MIDLFDGIDFLIEGLNIMIKAIKLADVSGLFRNIHSFGCSKLHSRSELVALNAGIKPAIAFPGLQMFAVEFTKDIKGSVGAGLGNKVSLRGGK